ncbi:alpha/beta hydrolase [Parahaliea maris]|uniref:Alpha/beta hydrolase n=1 Tax=Parahaliea maris TaxID=2716870 RepID=A0A5C8ZZN1_9GAMM|nr:alpha/beta hydrolase [Parahaliea maris]
MEPAADRPGEDCIVLLHGLGRTQLSMVDMAWALRKAGYNVANITYPSLLYSIDELAVMAVNKGLAECVEFRPRHVHFVTHSLGGILVREYLAYHRIAHLGRVVMLGPPNQGSELADYYAALDWLGWLRPAAIAQLGTGPVSVPRQLGPVDFELGVIAGTLAWRPPLPGAPSLPSDGTVSVAETRVEGTRDFIQMPASHTFMMWNADVQGQVIYFLRNGSFAAREGLTDH